MQFCVLCNNRIDSYVKLDLNMRLKPTTLPWVRRNHRTRLPRCVPAKRKAPFSTEFRRIAERSEDLFEVGKGTFLFLWWRIWGSNPRPLHCQCNALPAELIPRITDALYYRGMGFVNAREKGRRVVTGAHLIMKRPVGYLKESRRSGTDEDMAFIERFADLCYTW